MICAGVLSACGASSGGGGDPLPVNASVQISPASITWDIADGPDCTAFYQDYTISITVFDAHNSPLGNVDLRIVADFAANTASPPEVLRIYEDFNGNGVVDDPAEYVSSNTSPAFMTKTARYTGTKIILLRAYLGCNYRGNLWVYAGPAFANMNIEVKEPAAPGP